MKLQWQVTGERFFNCIKQMRGLATRYDRRADNYFAALKLAAVKDMDRLT
jgi:transposase